MNLTEQLLKDVDSLGKRIRDARHSKEMSLEYVAFYADSTPQSLHRYETGKVIPPLTTLIKICRAMDCDFEKLLFTDEYKKMRREIK